MMLLRLMSGHSNVLRSTVPRYFTSTVSERTSASNKFEKKIPGIREHYEFISEWCHPNGSGHLFTYGEINKQNGTVRFSEVTPRVKGIQGHIMGCFMLILFMEPIMAAFDEIIPKASEIDPRAFPDK